MKNKEKKSAPLRTNEPDDLDAQLYLGLMTMSSATYEYLHSQCFHSIKKFVTLNSGSDRDAEDCFINGVATLCANAQNGSYVHNKGTKVKTYLYAVCWNQWLSYLKSPDFRISRNSYDSFSEEFSDDRFIETGDAGYEEFHIGTMKILEDELGKLGKTCQQLIKLYYFGQLSSKKIATMLNSTEGTVKVSRFRCVKQLKRLIFMKIKLGS